MCSAIRTRKSRWCRNLGAKIISVKSLRTGREWMWRPPGELELFRNLPGDNFSRAARWSAWMNASPTIEPCVWRGRKTSRSRRGLERRMGRRRGSVAKRRAENLRPSGNLPVRFRTQLRAGCKRDPAQLPIGAIEARRRNISGWAMHPLLNIQEGDRLVLPASTRALLDGAGWVDAVDSTVPKGNCSKLLAGPLSEGFSGIHNLKNGRSVRCRMEHGGKQRARIMARRAAAGTGIIILPSNPQTPAQTR